MADKLILANDSAFFVATIDVPSGLSDSDAREFVKTWIENTSPMPIEKVRFGFLKKANKIVVWVGVEDRVYAGLSKKDLASCDYLVPTSSLLLLCNVDNQVIILNSKKSLAYIDIKNGLVEEFCSIEKTGDNKADLKMLRELSESDSNEKFYTFDDISVASKSYISVSICDENTFVSGNFKNAQKQKLSFSSKSLPLVDVRDVEAVKKFIINRRKAKLKRLGICSIPAFFALLLFAQGYLFYKTTQANSLQAQLDEIAPQAKIVEEQSERLAELRMFTEKRLHAISSLALLNNSRDIPIGFLRYEQKTPLDIELSGSAPMINLVQSFAKKIKELPEVASSELKTETSKGAAKFTLNIKLK